jgi:hypothetical protein
MTIICKCDVKNCEGLLTPPFQKEEITVKFTTEQNEGRSCEPYLQKVDIHICKNCKEKLAKDGKYLQAYGAMGYNTYHF